MAIVSHPANENYRNNWEATFGKKSEEPQACLAVGDEVLYDVNGSLPWLRMVVLSVGAESLTLQSKDKALLRVVTLSQEGTNWRRPTAEDHA
jgi:hypothetical protein